MKNNKSFGPLLFITLVLPASSLADGNELPPGVSAPIESVDCKNLRYDQLEIASTHTLKEMVDKGDEAFNVGKYHFDPKDYPKQISILCAQVKCLSDRDHLNPSQMKKKIIKASQLPSAGKQELTNSFDKLQLFKCTLIK